MKLDKLRRQAKALQGRKASIFHNPSKNKAPSTAYGTRAAGSADKDRQLRSSQALQDLNAAERQASGRGADLPSYAPRTLPIVPGSAVRAYLPLRDDEE